MVGLTGEQFLNRKGDYSEYLVHLTRSLNGNTSGQVLLQILRSYEVKCFKSHCLFSTWLDVLPAEFQHRFNVACFSESPLEFVGDLVSPVQGRKVQLEPYGIAVKKEVAISAGGNPALYTNRPTADVLQNIWRLLVSQKNWEDLSGLMPFVSLMERGRYDFHWEREWRVPGGLPITPDNVAFIVCSERDIPWLKDSVRYYQLEAWLKVPMIDASWGPERLIQEVSD